MEQYALYLALKMILQQWQGQAFTFGFNDMDANADFDCGIYVSGEAPGTARDMQGNYYNRLARVQFLAQSDLSHEGNLATAGFMGFIRNTLPTTLNKTCTVTGVGIDSVTGFVVQDPEGSLSVGIVVCDIAHDTIPLGKNSQGRQRYSLNALVTYTIIHGGEN